MHPWSDICMRVVRSRISFNSREALRRYDAELNQINLHFHELIIDACFEIIETYGKIVE